MVTRTVNGKIRQYPGVYYDVEVGYHILWKNRYNYDDFDALEDFLKVRYGPYDFCILCPALPHYDLRKSPFSSGTLKPKFDLIEYGLKWGIRLDVI